MIVRRVLALEARLELAAVGGGESILLAPRGLGGADELVAGLVVTEGILWPGLVAGTVCGRLSRRESRPAQTQRGLDVPRTALARLASLLSRQRTLS